MDGPPLSLWLFHLFWRWCFLNKNHWSSGWGPCAIPRKSLSPFSGACATYVHSGLTWLGSTPFPFQGGSGYLRGWGLPPSPFKGGLGTICVLWGWRGSSRGWAWHTLVLGFQNCLQIEHLNGFGAILTSQAVREDLEGRLEIQNCALARPLSINIIFWVH